MSADTADGRWRGTLAGVAVGVLIVFTGLSLGSPFMPIFIARDLGLRGPDVALWTGITSAMTGLSLAIASPIWGAVGDRYGRKALLLRAVVGGALSIGLTSIARGVLDLVALRLVQGALSGALPVASALIVDVAPPSRVAFGLGVLSAMLAAGQAFGPVVGGIAAAALPLRQVFAYAGIAMLLALIPVVILVKEERGSAQAHGTGGQGFHALRYGERPVLIALAVLVASQGLMAAVMGSSQVLVTLRLLELSPADVTRWTAIAFGASGLTNGLFAVLSGTFVLRWGYVGPLRSAACVLVASLIGLALAPTTTTVIAGAIAFGVAIGLIFPMLAALTGLASPRSVRGTVFGIVGSAVALGFMAGPLMAGTTSALVSTTAGFLATSGVATVLLAASLVAIREPAPSALPSDRGSVAEAAGMDP